MACYSIKLKIKNPYFPYFCNRNRKHLNFSRPNHNLTKMPWNVTVSRRISQPYTCLFVRCLFCLRTDSERWERKGDERRTASLRSAVIRVTAVTVADVKSVRHASLTLSSTSTSTVPAHHHWARPPCCVPELAHSDGRVVPRWNRLSVAGWCNERWPGDDWWFQSTMQSPRRTWQARRPTLHSTRHGNYLFIVVAQHFLRFKSFSEFLFQKKIVGYLKH